MTSLSRTFDQMAWGVDFNLGGQSVYRFPTRYYGDDDMMNYALSMTNGKTGTVVKCLFVLGLVAACGDASGDAGGFINAGS